MNTFFSKHAFIFFALVLFCFLNIKICHARRAIPDDLIAHPVLVTLPLEDSTVNGSGFYIRHAEKGVFLVSSYHVFMEVDKNKKFVTRSKKAYLLSYPKNLDWSNAARFQIDLELMLEKNLIRFDPKNDTFAMRISKEIVLDGEKSIIKVGDGVKKLSEGSVLTVPIKNTKRYDEVLIGNDIYISGYPSSIGVAIAPQFDYNKPLLRRGIVAGKFDDRKTIIIDCPTFGGNSGGPVIEIEEVDITTQSVRVIGIIAQFVPFVEKWINQQHKLINREYENSGYTVVVPIDKVIELIEQF